MKSFFWWCAGVHRDTLERYPEEQNKYISIGATIFFTGLFAALAGGYALYFVFSGSPFALLYALVFGLIWGLAIFNLDRYIVLSIDKSRSGGMQFLQALPRILLAILIGLIISRPLELKIFDKEIREYLRTEYLVQQNAKIDTLNKTFENKYLVEYGQLNALKTQADSLESSIKTSRQQLNHEIFGTKTDETSGVMGYGPYAKMKEGSLNQQQVYLDTLRSRIQQKESSLLQRKSAEGLMDQRILSDRSLDSAVNVAGFADRNAALSNLHKKPDGTVNKSTEYAVIFIALLFIFFECLPVFVKLMSGRDAYDNALKNQKEIHEYESDTSVRVEKTAIDKIEDYRVDASIKRRMDKLSEEFSNS
ncbi:MULTISPECIES: DUF4407 domain-containing protein [unclassified Sphingobacterium]|uniref:DUF4407 domain-containing protein n=1 Tax=unclassified Sphingobacterium TaxID=2609468 RepID=UPI00265CC4A0|nr:MULTISPECIES: DUF4407 domain-containing protein [unclassified Sphingobacterium]WKK58804.1 DUF4407 domain-containing protein [Sphingobacterium sp. BN32]